MSGNILIVIWYVGGQGGRRERATSGRMVVSWIEGQVHDMIPSNADTSLVSALYVATDGTSTRSHPARPSSEQIFDPKGSAACHTISVYPSANHSKSDLNPVPAPSLSCHCVSHRVLIMQTGHLLWPHVRQFVERV